MLKIRQILLLLIFIIVSVTACRPDILRYANRAVCSGWFRRTNVNYNYVYPFPIQIKEAGIMIVWDIAHQIIVLQDRSQLMRWHFLDVATGSEIKPSFDFPIYNGASIDLSQNGKNLVVNLGTRLFLYDYGIEKEPTLIRYVMRTSSPAWSLDGLYLTGIYYPENYETGSNVIGVFDITQDLTSPVQSYELDYSAISEVLGWSYNNKVIAVSQYAKNGLIPHYIFLEGSVIKKSTYGAEATYSCLNGAEWSPNEQKMVFSGENNHTFGRDIFVDEIRSGQNNDPIVTMNLTNSPRQDEYAPVWSPDGKKIVYVKAFEERVGDLRQDLFVINADNQPYVEIQMTNTLDEFETNPLWVSEEEIIYASWSPTNSVWFLKVVSITSHEQNTIMELPSLWYYLPEGK